jgi:hypothetical protein
MAPLPANKACRVPGACGELATADGIQATNCLLLSIDG